MTNQTIFNWVSNVLRQNETHFKLINLWILPGNYTDTEIILHDNTFGNITFENLSAFSVKKISANAFNNTKDKIKTFNCAFCSLVNEPPKYDLRKVINELTELTILQPDLNVTEIPSTAIEPINGQPSKIYILSID